MKANFNILSKFLLVFNANTKVIFAVEFSLKSLNYFQLLINENIFI